MKSIPILNIFSNHKYKYAIPFNNDICFMDSISKTLVHKVKPLSIRKIDKHESYIYYNEILFNAHIKVKYLFYKNKLYAVEFSANNLLNPNLDFIIKSFEKLINGNVLTYGNKSFTWSSGRNLARITDGNNTYSYTYDENGIRTSKTVNGVTTYFNTKDGVILSQTDGTNTMYFQYDTNGFPLGFIWNDTQYLYITNQMGDVISITDTQGNELVQYEYDEWGALGSITTTNNTDEENALANINPLRYRGYYYDSETGYYYLQSRYYDAGICRFINSDLYDMAGAANQISESSNLMSYCNNNPINSIDEYGFSNKNNLSKGWRYRIDPANPSKREHRHIHVYKNGEDYSQNDDGSSHKGGGEPPNSVKKELKEKTGWDWDEKKESYKESQKSSPSIQLDFSNVGVVVVYVLIFALLLASGVGIVIFLGLIATGGLVLA